jgi:protein ImuB
MFAVIHLPQFALQAALRHEPELWAYPVALVDPALNTPRVCDLTAPARAAGVMEGLTPTQALARCRDVRIRHRSRPQETAATDAVLQCAFGFSPNIENTAPGTVTLDLHGLSELMERPASASRDETAATRLDAGRGPAFQSWAARLRSALAALNLTARIGIGPTPNVARHAAFWSVSCRRPPEEAHGLDSEFRISKTELDRRLLPPPAAMVDEPRTFVASLPVAALEPSTDVAVILHQWGIRTVGELLALGQDAVVDRLGLEALALFAAASTTAMRPIHLVPPAGNYGEAFDFEHAVETMEPLLFILKRLVDALAQRLELGGLAAEILTLKLRLESGAVLARGLRVPQPTRRADVLFRMLQTHLETLRTNSPIVGVALEADPAPPEQRQFSLFEAALRDPHQFQETLARLSALLGADRVGSPVLENSHRPDAFKLVPPDFEKQPGHLRESVPEILRGVPMRRLRPAVKAKVEVSSKFQAQSSKEDPKTKRQYKGDELWSGNIVELLGPLFSAPPGFEVCLPSGALEASAPASSDEPRQKAAALQDAAAATLPPVETGTASPLQPFNHSTSTPPLSLHCRVAKGKLTIALGPWRASGHWWDQSSWQRDEWDVQTRGGSALRLVHHDGEWHVEAIVD